MISNHLSLKELLFKDISIIKESEFLFKRLFIRLLDPYRIENYLQKLKPIKKGFINFMIHFYRKHLFPQPFLKDKQQDILFFQNEFLMVFQKQLKRLMQN